ncbi:decarboxylase UbiD [Niabella ginsenosidivorans]|uniref:Pyrrole-2-carboxylic acid decarboxylase n=1 Tax=Niabella ginsenosidivorans TaxID=1176587 RepID=A0A1A9I6P2_9BACT|nr:UbiD family decarboxylase [Niabella ginsenosidivorans]ANH82719.1 decarboxylase UbiD [Niabella ginsenosidivorans]
MKHLKSLRAFIEALKQIGEVQEIDEEVDWDLEMSAITRRSMDLRAPMPVFNKIKNIAGFRALGAPGGLSAKKSYKYSRVNIALGVEADASPLEVIEKLVAARKRDLIPPVISQNKKVPCKENVWIGDDVDLLKLPTPKIHMKDGGRYLQTFGLNIVTTPDGSWTNWSINRMMLIDKTRLACLIPPNQHLGMIHAKWKEKGAPTPVAIALGVEPGLPYVGGMPVPENVDEAAYLGAYFNEPLELVRAETVNILVPATAEIIIEGHISHIDVYEEGPMDEYPGYVGDEGSPKPVLHVSAITYRDNAILPFAVAGTPVDENHTGWGLPHAAETLYLLRSSGLPVSMCWIVLESANHWMVVAVRKDWHEITNLSSKEVAEAIGNVVFHSKAGFGIAKIILLEDDIDVTNPEEVIWAFASRAHPYHSEIYFSEQAQNILPVFLEPTEKQRFKVTKVIYNCLLADRFDRDKRPVRSDFNNAWPASLQEKVLQNWKNYGYSDEG